MLVSWTTLCAFFVSHRGESGYLPQFNKFFFLIILVLGYLFSLFIYYKMHSALEKQRVRVRNIVREFRKNTTFALCYGHKGAGQDALVENVILYGGVSYMALMYALIMCPVKLEKAALVSIDLLRVFASSR